MIDEYLKSLDLHECDGQSVAEFLELKQVEIDDYLRSLWNEFKQGKDLHNKKSVDITSLEIESTTAEATTKSQEELVYMDANRADANVTVTIEELEIAESKTSTPIQLEKNTSANLPQPMTNIKGDAPLNPEGKENNAYDIQVKSKSISITNGKVNQPYQFNFCFQDLAIADVGAYWFEGLESIGLSFNSETNHILGTPIIAGDHKIKLKIKRNDWIEGKPIFEREFTLIVNPDPKTLWKNIPTPNDIEYFKPDSDKAYVKVLATSKSFGFSKQTQKDMVAASQRGRSHAQEGKPRDDDFALKYLSDSHWYIMSVADGAGSAASSRKGAQIACQTAVSVCETQITAILKDFEQHIKDYYTDSSEKNRKVVGDDIYQIIGNAVFAAYKGIESEAQRKNKPVKDFATTLIVSICKKFKSGWFVSSFWVGDGAIGIYDKPTGFLKVLGETDGGEYAGQTRFLTMPEITQPKEIYRRLRFEIVKDFTALILMTDGVTDPKFETDANLLRIERWNELWSDINNTVKLTDDNETSADELLSWLDFWSPGNHDDRTIAILY
jgi:serine/threonine protein phosphatase PrpC